MEAEKILPDDIRSVLQELRSFKKAFVEMKQKVRHLESSNHLLLQEVALSREGEEKATGSLNGLTAELAKFQTSLSNLVETQQENSDLRKKLAEAEKLNNKLNRNLESERLSCYQLMEESRKKYEEEAEKNLAVAQYEADSLSEQLEQVQELLKTRTTNFQAKLRDSEAAKNEEIKNIVHEFQEKINNLQSALSATQAENRSLRDRLQLNTTTFQKKVQELEKQQKKSISTTHPALNPPSKSGKPTYRHPLQLPKLNFLASMDSDLIDLEEQSSPSKNPEDVVQQAPATSTTTAPKKRRRLFNPRAQTTIGSD